MQTKSERTKPVTKSEIATMIGALLAAGLLLGVSYFNVEIRYVCAMGCILLICLMILHGQERKILSTTESMTIYEIYLVGFAFVVSGVFFAMSYFMSDIVFFVLSSLIFIGTVVHIHAQTR